MQKHISGKSLRRARVRANHDRLRADYDKFVTQYGGILSYEQWLHPQMREANHGAPRYGGAT
jgi:predicted aminopeptidase